MPKVPMDYFKCCIYKIEHVDDESLVYVGHTTNFNKRKTEHKNNCKNDKCKKYNLKKYQMIRENGGWDAFKMIEVEKYPCNDKREAERRENEVMKELKASMNMRNSFRTEEEITEYKKERSKEYYNTNKPKIQEQMKEYRELNKEILKEKKKNIMKQTKK
jgi:tagatose-1,6-bisphosphate aldolase